VGIVIVYTAVDYLHRSGKLNALLSQLQLGISILKKLLLCFHLSAVEMLDMRGDDKHGDQSVYQVSMAGIN
jgi:hypothetical protein